MVAGWLIKLCLSAGSGACLWCSWCIQPGHSAGFPWAMAQGNWQLSGYCIPAHHLSSSCGQQLLPETAPSSSGTWSRGLIPLTLATWSCCGSARSGTCQPYLGLGPGFVGSARSETLKSKSHPTFRPVSWPVSSFFNPHSKICFLCYKRERKRNITVRKKQWLIASHTRPDQI